VNESDEKNVEENVNGHDDVIVRVMTVDDDDEEGKESFHYECCCDDSRQAEG
jgi:hypothetical protein